MTKAQLFGTAPKTRWTGSRALVALTPGICPTCDVPLDVEYLEEDALLRHGGYGATRRTERRYCTCGWSLLAVEAERAPQAKH